MRLFEERGYAATTIDDIAAEANVSRRTFFRYFASKEEAFLVDPAGKLEALHVALVEGPPDEPTIAAVAPGLLALTAAYFEPDIVRADGSRQRTRAGHPGSRPGLSGALGGRAVAGGRRGPGSGRSRAIHGRRIVAHATVAIMQAGVAAWLQDEALGDTDGRRRGYLRPCYPGARGHPGDAHELSGAGVSSALQPSL